jgi:non-ribosomal peptide synthetase component F
VLYIPTYLKEGVEINSFLAALDAIFIVYSNFTSTSNFSTKAAFLRKPVLATEKHVIGDETRTFDLGVCVGENDVEELRTGLQVLEEKIKKGQFGYDAYLEKHSTEVLVEGFRHILNTLYA